VLALPVVRWFDPRHAAEKEQRPDKNLISGTWPDKNGANDPAGRSVGVGNERVWIPPSHHALNKDTTSQKRSPQGRKRDANGTSYYDLAYDAALRHTKEATKKWLDSLTADQKKMMKECCEKDNK
jgi:hypothetical protein